jgi:hypothetical protein
MVFSNPMAKNKPGPRLSAVQVRRTSAVVNFDELVRGNLFFKKYILLLFSKLWVEYMYNAFVQTALEAVNVFSITLFLLMLHVSSTL